LETAVKDSRLSEDQFVIKRRRLCESCGFRFTTLEQAQLKEVFVIKKDGKREPFDREKIARSIKKAIHKSEITTERIESIILGIIRQLELSGDTTVETRVLGKMVLNELAVIAPVAFVRFASVYENFKGVDDFANIIKSVFLSSQNSEKQ
jgi:transcriptional repressor NrdR